MTPLCALSHVPCHDSVRAAYKKPAAISKMAGIMENSGLEDRSTPVISSLAIRYFSLSLSPVNFDETFQPLSLSPSSWRQFWRRRISCKKKKKERKEKKRETSGRRWKGGKDGERCYEEGEGKLRIWKVKSGSRLHSGLTSRILFDRWSYEIVAWN